MKIISVISFLFCLSIVGVGQLPYNFVQKSTDPNRDAYDVMGTSVAVDGWDAVTGLPGDDQDLNELNPLDSAGSVLCYRRNPDGTWNMVQKITPSDRALGDMFGTAVEIKGGQLFVGALYQDLDSSGNGFLLESGAVYVYEKVSGVWTIKQKIVAFDRNGGEQFGASIAVDGDFMFVGANNEDKDENGVLGVNSGSVYVYQKDNQGNWNFYQKLTPFDKTSGDNFGWAIDLKGGRAVVGSIRNDNDVSGNPTTLVSSGSAYIYELQGTSWVLKNKIVAPARNNSDIFGFAVMVDGDFVAVGANREDAGISKLGKVHVYRRDGSGNWVYNQTFASPNSSGTIGFFGTALKGENGFLFVGTPGESDVSNPLNPLYAAGSVHIFQRDGTGSYSFNTTIDAPVRHPGALVGVSVDVENGKLFVGAVNEVLDSLENPPVLDSAGAIYIFEQCIHANIPTISVVGGGALSICQGDSIQLAISPSDSLYSAKDWYWYTGNYPAGTLVDSTDTVWLKPTATTTYSITGEGYCIAQGTALDSLGTVTISVLSAPSLSVNASPNDTICQGQSVILTASGASTYTWDNGVTNGVSFTPLSTNTYKVIGTSSSGCVDSTTIEVVVNPNPTVGINYTGSTTICSGTAITLSGTGAQTYTWDNGVVDGVAFTPTATTTYTVTGTSASGCSGTDNITITVVPGPTVALNAGITTVCEGTPVTLTASGADTYVWNNGLGTATVQTVTPLVTTEYIVTGTQTATGCTDADTVTITVNPLPNVVANASPDDSLCLGETLTLSGSGAATYTWNNGVLDGITFTPTLGTVDYIVTGVDANGCSNKDTITILVSQPPTVGVNASVTTICSGQDVVLSGTGAQTYTWDNGVIDGQPFQPTVTTTYTVTGTDAFGCTGTAVQLITVNPSPAVTAISSAGGQPLCEGDTLTLTAVGTAQNYVWDNGIVNGQPFIPTVGTHLYKVIGTSANLCQDSAFISVVVNPQDDATIDSVPSLCGNQPVQQLNAVTPGGVWQGTGIIDASTGEFDPMVAGEGIHQIIYTTTGVCSDADTINIEVYPALIIAVYNDSVCFGDVDGNVSVEIVQGVAPYSYLWDTGETTAAIENLGEGTYTVEVRDSNNCIVNDTVVVFLTENCNYHLFVPNVFSPNGDGLNDVLYVRGKGFTEMTFVIYDRWGNKVFESSDREIGWDGRFRGKQVTSGVYVYYLKVKYYDGSEEEKEGNVGVTY